MLLISAWLINSTLNHLSPKIALYFDTRSLSISTSKFQDKMVLSTNSDIVLNRFNLKKKGKLF